MEMEPLEGLGFQAVFSFRVVLADDRCVWYLAGLRGVGAGDYMEW